jgi:hypothetical protein
MMVSILKILFPNVTDEELKDVKKTLDLLLNSNAIKKTPLLRYALHLSKEFL